MLLKLDKYCGIMFKLYLYIYLGKEDCMEIIYEERKLSDMLCHKPTDNNHTLACKPHLHYHIEMGYIMKGKTNIIVDSKEHIARSGDFFICFPNQIHEYVTIAPEIHMLFIFSPDLIPEFSKIFTSRLPKTNVLSSISQNDEMILLFEQALHAAKYKTPYSEFTMKGYLLAFFGKLFERLELCEFSTQNSSLLGSILTYCSKNYDQPITLSILEKELHVSKFHISHTLSSKLHMGFNDYINSLRISKACQYLQSSNMSVTEVSATVGFNTIRTFNRAFTKHTGLTPSQYRSKK